MLPNDCFSSAYRRDRSQFLEKITPIYFFLPHHTGNVNTIDTSTVHTAFSPLGA